MDLSGSREQRVSLHHLPNRNQNILYALFLFVSPISNLAVNALSVADVSMIARHGSKQLGFLGLLIEFSGLLPGAILALLAVNIVLALLRHRSHVRPLLLLFGVVSTLYLILNLVSVTYGIFAFKVQSLFLLGISSGIYVSINTVFLFWYWYIDYPTQVRRLQHPSAAVQIGFPGGLGGEQWLPSFLDYLYFTVMTSNTLGPPENHSACGAKAKLIQLIHSVLMLVLLVIFVSRAINTLA